MAQQEAPDTFWACTPSALSSCEAALPSERAILGNTSWCLAFSMHFPCLWRSQFTQDLLTSFPPEETGQSITPGQQGEPGYFLRASLPRNHPKRFCRAQKGLRFLPVLLQSRDLQEVQEEQSHVAAQLDLWMAVLLPAERPEGRWLWLQKENGLFPGMVIRMVAPCHNFNLRSWLETSSSPRRQNLGLAVPVMRSSWLLGQQLWQKHCQGMLRAGGGQEVERHKHSTHHPHTACACREMFLCQRRARICTHRPAE